MNLNEIYRNKKNIKIFNKHVIVSVLLMIFILTKSCFAVDIVSNNAIVIDAESGEVLYEKNSYEKVSIASLTKLMTALVCVENVESLDQKIEVDMSEISKYFNSDFALSGLKNKEEVTYYDLLCTMLLPSGADSASCIATSVFNDYDKFIEKMNGKAQELNMNDTRFSNPIGADDDNNFSTMKDMAILMQYILKNDILKQIISKDEYITGDGKLKVKHTIYNSVIRYGVNKNYIMGGKTGTTGNAGLCLASYSVDEGKELICIVSGAEMNSSLPYNIIDSEMLYEEISSKYNYLKIYGADDEILTLDTKYAKEDKVHFYLETDLFKYLENFEKDKVNIEYNGVDSVIFNTNVDTKLGEVNIYYADELIYTKDIILKEKLTFSFRKFLNKNIVSILIIICIIVVIILNLNMKGNKNKTRKKKNAKKMN